MIYQGAIKIKCSWPSLLNIKSFLMWFFDVLWKTYWRSNLSSKQTKVTGKARILLTFYNHHAVTQASLKKNKPKNPVTYDITPANLHIKVTANMHFSILQASYWVPPFIFIFLEIASQHLCPFLTHPCISVPQADVADASGCWKRPRHCQLRSVFVYGGLWSSSPGVAQREAQAWHHKSTLEKDKAS